MKLRLLSAVRNFLHRKAVEEEIDAEVRAFVGMVTDEQVAAGAQQAEAKRLALAECGGIEQLKQGVRDSRSGARFESFWQDLRFGTRQLSRSLVFAVATILML